MRKQIIAIMLMGIVLFVACGKKEETSMERPVKQIVSEQVIIREMSQIFESDAVLEPKDKVNHNTERGGTIEKIYKKNGDYVKKGDLVMSFSDAGTKASYLQALANLQTAESSYRIAQGNHSKFKQLYDRGLVSHLEYVSYENTLVSASGQLEVAKAMFQSAQSDYSKLERRADISGTIGNLFGKEGNKVNPLEDVFTVLNDSQMQAYIGLPGEYIANVKNGDHLTVHVDNTGKDYEAVIGEVNPIADTTTKNFMTKIILQNSEKEIKDGMYASINLPIGSKQVLSVPDEAIFVRNLISYVFKIVDGKAVRVEVQAGSQNGEYTEITSPDIKEGDKIVVKGLFGLQDGDKVEESTPADLDPKQAN